MRRLLLIALLVLAATSLTWGRTHANGSTSVTEYFVLRDSTNHTPKTDVTLTDIDLYYVEEGAAISAKADCTALAAADSAYASGGAFHCGQGLYRIDWPNAAFDGGAGKSVQLIVVCSGVDTTFLEVELSPSVTANVTQWGGTAVESVKLAATLAAGDVTGNLPADVQAYTVQPTVTGATLDAAYDAAKTAAQAGDAMTLADGAHGGAAATLTLKSIVVNNNAGAAVSLTGTTSGLYATANNGSAIVAFCTGGNGNGVLATGNGSGSGLAGVGGANGSGLRGTGSGLGDGIRATSGASGASINGSLSGDVAGKVLGGGASSITGTGARVVDASGNNVSSHSAADVAALVLATPAQKLVTTADGRVDVGLWLGTAPLALSSQKVQAEATVSLGATAPAGWIDGDALAISALAKFITADTGETVAAAGSVAKIAQGAAGGNVTVGDITQAALAKFASVDTGETTAVAGSVAALSRNPIAGGSVFGGVFGN